MQGSRPKPYEIVIEVKTLSDPEWAKVLDALGGQAPLRGEVARRRDAARYRAGFCRSRFVTVPGQASGSEDGCSCPDSSNPCKHIAAAYYLLGEEFDRDPFLIFTLRGMSREALIERLGAKTSSAKPKMEAAPAAAARPGEPLSVDVETFWNGETPQSHESTPVVEILREPASLLRRLGGFPFWRGENPLVETLTARCTPRPRCAAWMCLSGR